MRKKTIGYVLAALIIGAMIVIMVKNNLEETGPINNTVSPIVTSGIKSTDDYLIGPDLSAIEKGPGLKQGDVPPDFELTTLAGDVVKLSDLKGKKVMLNFWATWCPPCKAEMPHMERYYKKYKDKDNVEIIAVNVTTEEKLGIPGVERFVDTYGLTFPVPMDEEGLVSEDYQIRMMPTTYMIRTDGTIAHKIIAPLDEKMMKELIRNMN